MQVQTESTGGFGRPLGFGVLGLCLSFFTNVFFLQGRAVYLHRMGAEALPAFYMAFNVVAIALGITLVVRNVPARTGLQVSLFAMAAGLVAGTPALVDPGPWAATGLNFGASLFLMTAMIFYWNVVGRAFTMREIERWGQYLSATTLTGGILAGLAMPLFHTLSMPLVCGGSAALLTVTGLVVHRLPVSPRQAPPSRTGELMPMELFRSDLMNLLLLLTLLMGVIRYMSEYQFSHVLRSQLPDAAAISAYTGRMQAIVSAVTLVWQVVFLRRVLNSWRVTNLYLYTAVSLVAATMMPVFWPGLGVLAMHQGLINFLGKAIRQPSQNLLVKVMPSTLTAQANFLLSGLAESVTALAASMLIALLVHWGLTLRAFFVIGTILAALMVVTATRLPWPYVSLLVKRLQREGTDQGATLIDG